MSTTQTYPYKIGGVTQIEKHVFPLEVHKEYDIVNRMAHLVVTCRTKTGTHQRSVRFDQQEFDPTEERLIASLLADFIRTNIA